MGIGWLVPVLNLLGMGAGVPVTPPTVLPGRLVTVPGADRTAVTAAGADRTTVTVPGGAVG